MAEGSNPFTHPALQRAHEVALNKRRMFIDWDDFFAENGRWNRHYLIMGTRRNAFDKCHKTSLIDNEEAPYAITGLVRPYLRELMNLQGKPIARIERNELLATEPPRYFAGQAKGECLTLVDLEAAYWSIYSPVTWDLDYDGRSTPRNGHVRFLGADELKEHKLLRNAIMGTARAEYRTDLDFGKEIRVPIGPGFRKPSLWAYVQDILELIAWDMRSYFGALHILVDGYIIPHPDLAADAIDYLRSEWGVIAHVKAQGEGIVYGLGNWRIGDQFAGIAELTNYPMRPIDNMTEIPPPYLRAFHLENQEYSRECMETYLTS